MAIICEDLARFGVVLVSPSMASYSALRADIEGRLTASPAGAPPRDPKEPARNIDGSAVLLNQARVAIASIAYSWSFRTTSGHVVAHRFLPGTNPSVLLPFGLDDRSTKLAFFWHTVFPGSKRLMTSDGRWYGDNTDVRTPVEDEQWNGGGFSMRGGSNTEALEPVQLTLDSVFFVDGGFAGPNRMGVWEHTMCAAETHLACAALASESRAGGTSTTTFFRRVQQLTGRFDEESPLPPPPVAMSENLDPDVVREYEQAMIGWKVMSMRRSLGDEATIASIAAWSDVPAPTLHRLS